MPPTDSKPKLRPQQSCLKCRERKVKCDRSIPCHACIIRNLESECTYLTTAEDRAHMNQAEIIERLRREVAQLRGQLNQGPRGPSPGLQAGAQYARAYTGSHSGYGGGGGEPTDGCWAGSSPSSSTTTMTTSVTVTSPDSTGSDSGLSAQPHRGSAYPASAGTGPYGLQIAEVDVLTADGEGVFGNHSIDDATISHCQVGGMAAFAPGEIPGSISMQGLPSQSLQPPEGIEGGLHHPSLPMYKSDSPGYAVDDGSTAHHYIPGHGNYTNIYKEEYSSKHDDERSHVHQPQWGPGAAGHQVPSAPPYPDSSYYSSPSISSFANTDPNPHTHPSQPAPLAQRVSTHHPPNQESFTPSPISAIPSSWKGEGKQELLETLLETIGSCDEERVAQVVQVVRASATPEEAVSGLCQVLGIGGGR